MPGMKILYIEDDLAHVELTSRSLEIHGAEFDLQTAPTMQDAFSLLEATEYDVILCDYRLPDGTGLDVIKLAYERGITTAIVLITNQEDINTAVAALKAGAADYVVKQSDYLHRLPIVLRSAYSQTQLEKQKIALRESENRYRNIFENAVTGIFQSSIEGRFLSVNPAMVHIYGYESPEEMIQQITDIGSQIHVSLETRNKFVEDLVSKGAVEKFEAQNLRKDGSIIWTSTNARAVKDERGNIICEGFLTEITDRKQTEEKLERQLKELFVLHAATIAGAQSNTEDEIIEQVVRVTARIYSEVCGVLLLNDKGDMLIPHKSNLGMDLSRNWQEGFPITTGITGQAVQTGKAIRIGDSTKEQNFIEIVPGIKSEACVPFWVHDRIIGVFNVESKQADAYDEEDERFLNTLAGGLGTALEKLRLAKAEQTQRQHEAAILDLIRMAASSLDLNQVLQSILDQLIKVIPSDSGTIQLLEGVHLNILAAIGTTAISFLKRGPLMLSEFPLNNYIVTEKRTVRVDNVLLDDRYQHSPETSSVRSFLGIPLIANDKPIGMITLDSYQTAHFTEHDAELGLILASHASIAIENARLFDTEQRRRKQAEILREATAALTTTIELDKLFEIIFDSLAELVPYDSVFIEMINRGYFEVVAGRGIPSMLIGKKFPVDLKKWGGVEKLRQPLIIANVRMDNRFEKLEGLEYIVSWMGIHLFAQGKLIGCLNLDSKKQGFFNEECAAIAQTFANQVAIAIENARLFREEGRRSQIIEALANIANEIATSQEETSTLDRIAERSLSLLNASSVAVYLLQDDNKTIKIVSAQGEYQKELISHTIKLGEGVTGNIIANGKPEIIDDLINDPRRIRIPGTPEKDEELDTMMSAPLTLYGNSIGAINAWRLKSKGLFDISELNFLASIAHQASILIESVRLFDEITRRAQEAAAIAEVGRNISATLELDIVLERIATYAKDLLRAETSAVYLAESNSPLLRAISAIGMDADELKNDPIQIGMGILGDIAMQKYGEIINDSTGDSRAITVKGTQDKPYEHIIGVPVLSNNQLTGLLVVWRIGVDKQFKATDLDFLSSLAQQAAVAIENARLFQEEQKRRQEAENLQIAATVITSSLDPQEVLKTILVALKQVVPYDSASIFLLEGEQARITAAKGLSTAELVANQTYPASNALVVAIKESLQPLILEDAQIDVRFEKRVGAQVVRGWMGIPLIARGIMIGYITLNSCLLGAFTLHSAFLAQTFAHQAAAAIENSRLYIETRRRLEEQEVISRISFSLRAAKNSDEMLYLLLNQVLKAMDTNTASIWLHNPVRDELVQNATKGWLSEIPKKNFKPDEGIVGHVFSSGEMHISREFSNDPLTHSANANAFGKGWGGITMPIRTASNVIGALSVALPVARPIEQHHTQLLSTIAEIAGNAIQRVSLFEQSEKQVHRLTALREIDTAIASSFDLKVTLSILTNHTLALLKVSAVDVMIYNADQQTLNYFIGAGFRSSAIIQSSFRLGEGIAGKAMLERRDIFVENLSDEKAFLRKSLLAQEGFISYCAMPLISKGITQGVLEVFFREAFKPDEDWLEFLRILAGQATIAIDNTQLFENLQRSNQDLSLAYDTTLEGWGKALELRDKETQGHTRRVTDMTVKLAREMGIPEVNIVQIRRGALLHDIGKMGIPDNILRKKGPLTKTEWQEMWKHPQYAYDLLSSIPYLQPVLDIPYLHHEWWDGSGYPRGLKGDEIPLPARIFAVADVWDALLSDRSYRRPWGKLRVIKHLKEQSGTHFDPEIVKVFLNMIKKETK